MKNIALHKTKRDMNVGALLLVIGIVCMANSLAMFGVDDYVCGIVLGGGWGVSLTNMAWQHRL